MAAINCKRLNTLDLAFLAVKAVDSAVRIDAAKEFAIRTDATAFTKQRVLNDAQDAEVREIVLLSLGEHRTGELTDLVSKAIDAMDDENPDRAESQSFVIGHPEVTDRILVTMIGLIELGELTDAAIGRLVTMKNASPDVVVEALSQEGLSFQQKERICNFLLTLDSGYEVLDAIIEHSDGNACKVATSRIQSFYKDIESLV